MSTAEARRRFRATPTTGMVQWDGAAPMSILGVMPRWSEEVIEFLVRWKAYDGDDTWEPEEGLPAICIREFEEQATLQELDSLVSGFDSSEKCE